MRKFNIIKHRKKTFELFWLLPAILFFIFANNSYSQHYTVSRFDNVFCTTIFPTPYTTGSFSILETSNGGNFGFTKSQTNKEIIISLPANFEFNTAAAADNIVVNGGGSDMQVVSWSYIGNTQVQVFLTTSITRGQLNSLYFQNFEIRALVSGASGTIQRTGGAFKIDNSITNPTAAESLGNLSTAAPFILNGVGGTTTTNFELSDVKQYTINNGILQIKISGTGSCGSTVSQFNFNTDGGNGTGTALPTTNITDAKIYYTGSSSSYATTNFYGSTSSPNGAFSVTGSIDLANGDNYFWLAYDVPGDANTGAPNNTLDAKLESYVLNSVTVNDGTNPVGSRNIIPNTYYYSIATGKNWNDNTNWSLTDGGVSCGCQPNGGGVAVIRANHTITLNADRTVDALEIRDGGILNGGSGLTVNAELKTINTGKFTLSKALKVKGNMKITGAGGASTNTRGIDIDGDLEIDAGSSLTGTGSSGNDIYIGGNLRVDGTLEQTSVEIFFDGTSAGFTISGTGTVKTAAGKAFISQNSPKNIALAGTNITFTGDFVIDGNYEVSNSGIVTIQGNLDGTAANSQWTNNGTSTLKYGGSQMPFITAGTLYASAATNLIEYYGMGAQTIAQPHNGAQYQYWNLNLSGSGIKTLANDIWILNDLNISGAAELDVTAATFYSITINNNWTNTSSVVGAFKPRTGNVYFVAGNNQIITCSNGTGENFYNLNINKSGGKVTFNNNITVANQLTMTGGNIDLNSTMLTINSSLGAAITRTAGVIFSEKVDNSSKVKWNIGTTTGVHRIPFGLANGNSIPFYLNLTAGNIGNVTVSTYPTAADNTPYPTTPNVVAHTKDTQGNENSGNTVDRFWQIDKDGPDGTATLTFMYVSAERPPANPTILKAQRWNSVTSKWEDPLGGQTNNAVANWVTVPGVTQFSPWTIAAGDPGNFPLPITLTEFDAKLKNKVVDISWKTLNETNNDFFTVERSKNNNFEAIEKIMGAGSSTSPLNYFTQDKNPFGGVSYYRLKQTDFDGKFTYSKIVIINNQQTNTIKVTPNPITNNILRLTTTDTIDTECVIKIYNSNAALVYSGFGYFNNNTLEQYINLEKGIYKISISTHNTNFIDNIIVL